MNCAWTTIILPLIFLFQVLTLHLEDHPPLGATVEAVATHTAPLVMAPLLANHPVSTVARDVVFPPLAVAHPAIDHCARYATKVI
jgi:hypothetical protein